MAATREFRPAPQDHRGAVVYSLGDAGSQDDVLAAVRARFRVRGHPVSDARRVHLDTPDWRLRRSGASLTRHGNGRARSLELVEAGEPRPTRLALDRDPEFAWDLPPGRLRERVEPIVDVRRLLPHLEVRAQVQTFDVLDEREKIVVRVDVEQGRAHAGSGEPPHPMGPVLRLRPLRGYQRELAALRAFLEGDLGLREVPAADLERALGAVGRDPRAERLRWRVDLSPRESSGRAVRWVLARFLENMVASEAGLRGDVDTEYLHDFRVAVRRSRSILREVRAVFPPEAAERAAEDLAWLGAATTWLRDLDVFVLQIRERVRAGDPLWTAIDSVRDSIEAARERELQRVCAALDSERWLEFRAAWSAELGRSITPADPAPSRQPVVELASERIARLHRKVLQAAEELGPESPADDWHRLRIRCKKLRYMTDAFGGLYARKGLRRLVRRLKRLQALLGELNDRHVQVETLGRFTVELEGLTPGASFAMGRLSERYGARIAELRPEILARLREFARDQDRKRVRRLLAQVADS